MEFKSRHGDRPMHITLDAATSAAAPELVLNLALTFP